MLLYISNIFYGYRFRRSSESHFARNELSCHHGESMFPRTSLLGKVYSILPTRLSTKPVIIVSANFFINSLSAAGWLRFRAWHASLPSSLASLDFIILIEKEEESLSLASNSRANRLDSRTQRGNDASTTSSSFGFFDFASVTDLRVVSGGFAVARVIILHLVEPARNLSSPVRLAIVRSRRPGRPRASDVLSYGESTCKSIVDLRLINSTALACRDREAREFFGEHTSIFLFLFLLHLLFSLAINGFMGDFLILLRSRFVMLVVIVARCLWSWPCRKTRWCPRKVAALRSCLYSPSTSEMSGIDTLCLQDHPFGEHCRFIVSAASMWEVCANLCEIVLMTKRMENTKKDPLPASYHVYGCSFHYLCLYYL